MKRTLIPSLIAGIALCGLLRPAQAQIPLLGTFDGQGTIKPVSPTMFQLTTTSDGNSTILGAFTGQATVDIDFSPPPPGIAPDGEAGGAMGSFTTDGTFTESFFGGDVSGTIAGNGTVTPSDMRTFTDDFGTIVQDGIPLGFSTGTLTNVYTVTTGTGIFTGTTGQITITATFVRNGPTVTANGTFTGFLSVPEPGSIAFLLGMGTMGAGLLLKRRRR